MDFTGLKEKVRARVPEGVRQKLLAMSEEEQPTTAIGEPVRAINVNEKSVVVPKDDIETIDINKVQEPLKAVPKEEPVINVSKQDDTIQYNIAENLNKTTIVDAEYQIPYGKEPFLGQEQILDAIKIVTLGSVALDVIFAILNAGVIPCVLLVIVAILVHTFLVQEYNHPTYV